MNNLTLDESLTLLGVNNGDWNATDRKLVGGLKHWATVGNKRCLEKLRVLEEIRKDAEVDEAWMRSY